MRVLIIGNPVAGGGKAALLTEELVRLCRAKGYATDSWLTGARGEATIRVRQLNGAYQALVVVGGDGTLNEVINGIPMPTPLPIAFLPAGTGNVIAYELGLRTDPSATARALELGRIRRIDVGTAGERRFLMVASVGFDALVTHEVMKTRRGTYCFGAYALPIARALLRYRPPSLAVTVDGQKAVAGSLAIVSKTPYYGGIFKIVEAARCDSGYFDLCVFAKGSIPSLALYAAAGLRGCLRRVPGIARLRGRHVVIASKRPADVEVDGDYLGTTPVTLNLLPGALSFLVPLDGRDGGPGA